VCVCGVCALCVWLWVCVRRIYFEQPDSQSERTSVKSNEGGTAVFNEDLFLHKAYGYDTLVVEVWDADQCSGDDLLGQKKIILAKYPDCMKQRKAFNCFLDESTTRMPIQFGELQDEREFGELQDKRQSKKLPVVYLACAYNPETSAGVGENTMPAVCFEEQHRIETEKQARAIDSLRELQQNLFEEGVSWQEACNLLRPVEPKELKDMCENERSPEELLESSVRNSLCKKLQAAAEKEGSDHACICGACDPVPARTAASLSIPPEAPPQVLFKATFGKSEEAARGLSRFVMLDDTDKSRSLARGCEALQSEFVKYGSIQDMENYFYIRYGHFS